ncbi:MAG: hypothetical protein KKA84_12030 [Bacteroidetes bacterium]|nr:hypothetical protein [Bacteroidota bacterium]
MFNLVTKTRLEKVKEDLRTEFQAKLDKVSTNSFANSLKMTVAFAETLDLRSKQVDTRIASLTETLKAMQADIGALKLSPASKMEKDLTRIKRKLGEVILEQKESAYEEDFSNDILGCLISAAIDTDLLTKPYLEQYTALMEVDKSPAHDEAFGLLSKAIDASVQFKANPKVAKELKVVRREQLN